METDCVFCEGQTEFLYEMWMSVSLQIFNSYYIDISHRKEREKRDGRKQMQLPTGSILNCNTHTLYSTILEVVRLLLGC
jgi:hypothetical protein